MKNFNTGEKYTVVESTFNSNSLQSVEEQSLSYTEIESFYKLLLALKE